MAKVAVLQIDSKTGAVKATVTKHDNHCAAVKQVKPKGLYACIEVEDASKTKATTETGENE